MTIIGAISGAILAVKINPIFLSYLMPILLLILFIFNLFNHKPATASKLHLKEKTFFVIFGLGIGCYNGFFGPSTGTFWTLALLYFLALDIKQAVMRTKPLNFIGNFSSLLIFIYHGAVSYAISIPMGMGQIIGANLGAHAVLKGNGKLIRIFFLIMTFIMLLHAFYKTFISFVILHS